MTERERFIELLNEWGNKENDGVRAESIADYLLANGIIVPPCKVGNALYLASTMSKRIIKVIITGVRTSENDYELITDNGSIQTEYIGKTVFLTKEEAEKALEERRENDL